MLLSSQTANCISRAGRILTRLEAMVPLTVRDTVACPLRALPARLVFWLERKESQRPVEDLEILVIVGGSLDSWPLSIRIPIQTGKIA
jgi:hypothetical protein